MAFLTKNKTLFALSVVCLCLIILPVYDVITKSRNMHEFKGNICEGKDSTTSALLSERLEVLNDEVRTQKEQELQKQQ